MEKRGRNKRNGGKNIMPKKRKKSNLSNKILTGIAITFGILAIIVIILLTLHYFGVF